jgi:hypothetical protein
VKAGRGLAFTRSWVGRRLFPYVRRAIGFADRAAHQFASR